MVQSSKLNPALVEAMRVMVETTQDSLTAVGKRLGVSQTTVSREKVKRGWLRPGEVAMAPDLARATRHIGGASPDEPHAAPGVELGEQRDAAVPPNAPPAGPEGASHPLQVAPPGAPGVSGEARRRAVLDRLWAVVEHQVARMEGGIVARSHATLSRDVSILVKSAETLARVVQNWPPESAESTNPDGRPDRSLPELRDAFYAHLCRIRAERGIDPPVVGPDGRVVSF